MVWEALPASGCCQRKVSRFKLVGRNEHWMCKDSSLLCAFLQLSPCMGGNSTLPLLAVQKGPSGRQCWRNSAGFLCRQKFTGEWGGGSNLQAAPHKAPLTRSTDELLWLFRGRRTAVLCLFAGALYPLLAGACWPLLQ